jgi:hypothetical protein
VTEGSNPRFALPEWLRSAAQGVVGLGESTQTGELTPEALALLTLGSVGTGAALAPRHATPEVLKTIRAYHGSPHDFDKFDLSKIGTGEGRQGFGHGLYFAEKEDVAKSYRDLGQQPGKMYEVDIRADPEKMLNWDAPLSAQPSVVQDLARNADLSHLKPGNRSRVMLENFRAGTEQANYPATGHTLHNALSDYGGKPDPVFSRYLQDHGFPGIRYVDRSPASEGSSNYIIFNPDIVEIRRKYALGGGAPPPGFNVAPPPQQPASPPGFRVAKDMVF